MKTIVNKFKKLFTLEDGPDLSRRKFIRDAGALAALTVVATSLPSLLKQQEIQRQVLSGLVENQTFYIDETIFIEIDNLVIRNCTFIASKPLDPMIHVRAEVKGLIITHCIFDNPPSNNSSAIGYNLT